MQQDILFAHDLEDVGLRRQGRIGCGLERPIFQLGEGVVRHQWHEMRHRERAIELVEVGLLQIEKGEEQVAEICRTIRFHFQSNGIAAAGTPQFLLNRAQQILRFFFVDVEIAIAGNAKGVDAVENEAGEKLGDVMFDERGEVNVIPGLVMALVRAASKLGAGPRAAPARWQEAVRHPGAPVPAPAGYDSCLGVVETDGWHRPPGASASGKLLPGNNASPRRAFPS